MLKTIKSIALVISLSVMFSSCVNTDETERTAETEQQELNEAIAKLEKANYNVDTTDLGVFYIMNKMGTGAYPQKSDTCYLIYTGFFLNGVIFDASAYYFQDSIWKFNYLEVNLIPGFNDGIALLNKGAEADIIIPSNLAYGSSGYGEIPPYTPLVFSMKMRDLRPTQ
jgi:FKBP-type peptidyl-prolyl cis-trans isomerase FkpA